MIAAERILALIVLSLGLLMVYRPSGKLWLGSEPPDPEGSSPSSSPTCFCSMVETHGYQCKEYNVITQDGYILTVHRIPTDFSTRAMSHKTGQPVLLQHGILMDGMSWLLGPSDQSLALILAGNGFDVWIANSRGTRFSRGHTSLSPDQPEYWAWSWDKLAKYDLPAVINLVYDQTGQKLHYIGHSLGTLIALASFSQKMVVDKVKAAALLCPISYLSHITTMMGQVAAKSFIGEMTEWLGVVQFNLKIEIVSQLLKTLCKNPGTDCYNLMISFTGRNCCLNSSTVELFLQNEPQPTSTINLVHLAQMIRSGNITMYDYGNADKNMKHYGQKEPPVYNMSNIPSDLPLFLAYGGRDPLSNIMDVHLLLDALKFHEGDKLTVHFIYDYAHADFIMGVNAKQMVYDAVISFLNRH